MGTGNSSIMRLLLALAAVQLVSALASQPSLLDPAEYSMDKAIQSQAAVELFANKGAKAVRDIENLAADATDSGGLARKAVSKLEDFDKKLKDSKADEVERKSHDLAVDAAKQANKLAGITEDPAAHSLANLAGQNAKQQAEIAKTSEDVVQVESKLMSGVQEQKKESWPLSDAEVKTDMARLKQLRQGLEHVAQEEKHSIEWYRNQNTGSHIN